MTDYVKQIYIYLRRLEREQNVEKDYLGNKKGQIRSELISLDIPRHGFLGIQAKDR